MSLQTYIEEKSPDVLHALEADFKEKMKVFEAKLAQKLDQVKRHYDQNVSQEIESKVTQFKFTLKHEKRISLAKAKEEVMNGLYREVMNSIFQDSDFLSHYVKKFLQTIKEVDFEGEIFVYGPQSGTLKKELTAQKIDSVKDIQKDSIWGGMIFVSEEVDIDYNLDDLLEKLKEASSPLVTLLFA